MFGLKIQPNVWGNYRILYRKANKEASTLLCSVVKHLEAIECFPFTSFALYRFLRDLQQNRAQLRLLYLVIATANSFLINNYILFSLNAYTEPSVNSHVNKAFQLYVIKRQHS